MTYYVLKYFLGGYFWFNKEATWLKKKIVSESIQTCFPSQHTFPPMQRTFQKTNFTQSVLILFLVFFHTHYNTEANLISSLSSSLMKKAPSYIIHFAFMLMYLNILNRFFLFCDNGLAWRLTLLAWKSKVRVCVNHQNNSLCYLEV